MDDNISGRSGVVMVLAAVTVLLQTCNDGGTAYKWLQYSNN